MKDIAPFKIDKWLLDHGSKEKIDLHGSYIAAMSMNQLKQLSNDSSMSPFDGDLQLTYGNAQGSVALRRRIAELHSSEDVQLSEENVVVTTGSILANYLVLTCLFGPTDHVICQYPTYGQLYILPRFQGAEVDLWRLQADRGWVPDVDKLSRMIKPNTRAIIINNPGNPAGTVIPKSQLHEIIHLARMHNLLVFSDEVFHPLFHGVEAPPPLVSLGYDRSISTGSVSKAHGLPGLRLGWVVSPDRSLLGRIMTARDYTTIAVSQLDDSVAAFALSPAVLPRLLERNLAVCSRTIEILRAFVKRNPGRCVWLPPQGAGTAFIQVLDGNGRPADDVAFSVQLLEKFGVSVIPGGHCFGDDLDGDFKGYIRISLGEEEGLKRALPLLQECLDQYK